MNKIKTVALGSIVAMAVAACSGSGQTHQSSQTDFTDRSPGNVTQMPSGFRNVAWKCERVGGQWFAVFSASNGGNGDNLPGSVSAWPDAGCANGMGAPR